MSRFLALAVIIPISWITAPAAAFTFEDCSDWGEGAKLTMQMRQVGVPIVDAMKTAINALKESGAPVEFYNFQREIILEAYRRPLERTERTAQVSAIEYGEEIFSMCLSGMNR